MKYRAYFTRKLPKGDCFVTKLGKQVQSGNVRIRDCLKRLLVGCVAPNSTSILLVKGQKVHLKALLPVETSATHFLPQNN